MNMFDRSVGTLTIALAIAATGPAVTAVAGFPAERLSAQVIVSKPVWTGLSAKAQKQIDDVGAAMEPLRVQEKARSLGYIPIFGWIPTMGTHWVNGLQMLKQGKSIDLKSPAQLMYSPVNGKEMLVGAAYAYVTSLQDTTRPPSFDGNPMWHEHPDLAPPGMRLVMVHVWFVPSPDGAFAGHNPNLPFWAVGVTPPDQERMKDPLVDTRVRKTAMALAVLADTSGLFPALHKRPAIRAVEAARSDSIRALLPELDAAAKAKDWARWDRAADRAVTQWDALAKVYLDGALKPENKALIQRFIDESTMKMDHGHMSHEH